MYMYVQYTNKCICYSTCTCIVHNTNVQLTFLFSMMTKHVHEVMHVQLIQYMYLCNTQYKFLNNVVS